MAARSIITNQPDVACAVCGRHLLRGEHAEAFLAGGERRLVCELCAPRATHEGWLRERDGALPLERPSRSERRTLLTRLRQRREAALAQRRQTEAEQPEYPGDTPYAAAPGYEGESADLPEVAYSDEHPGDGPAGAAAAGAEPARERAFHRAAARAQASAPASPPAGAADLNLARALEVFNAGEPPRRIAGVARSLGVPLVSARVAEVSGGVVSIVVAWELCWYRYEVDLDDEDAGVRQVAQGTELDELAAHERTPNAAADERGALALL